MAEWFKAAVLKTADRKVRGFESYSLRQTPTPPPAGAQVGIAVAARPFIACKGAEPTLELFGG